MNHSRSYYVIRSIVRATVKIAIALAAIYTLYLVWAFAWALSA